MTGRGPSGTGSQEPLSPGVPAELSGGLLFGPDDDEILLEWVSCRGHLDVILRRFASTPTKSVHTHPRLPPVSHNYHMMTQDAYFSIEGAIWRNRYR